jgi:hypothetical protein
VGLGSTFFNVPSVTTILSADSTTSFALTCDVQLTSAPGSSVPSFSYWTMSAMALQ